jgi:Putative peptidoglycan binding domain
MRILGRTLATAVLTGLVAAVLVAPPQSASAALPKCTDFSTFLYDGKRFYIPSAGSNTRNWSCTLRRGDRGAGVYVLQGNLNACHRAGLVADAIYGQHTEAVITWMQAANGSIAVDGVYGPVTGSLALKWAGYYAAGGEQRHVCYRFDLS